MVPQSRVKHSTTERRRSSLGFFFTLNDQISVAMTTVQTDFDAICTIVLLAGSYLYSRFPREY